MTMVVKTSEKRQTMIDTPMLIFTNANNNYPIQGFNFNILSVYYKMDSKGWMD